MENAETPAVAAAPSKTARIQCITDLGVWANVVVSPKETKLRQLKIDEVAVVNRDRALDAMKRNRHVVEIGQ